MQDINTNKICITSIGLDGEKIDQVTFMEKPRIFVKKGYLVATAKNTLPEFEAEYEIIKKTDIFTSIGPVYILEIKEEGNALIAGPSIVSDMEKLVKIVDEFNVEKIMVDGAFFRHNFTKISNATVLIIGANYSPVMEKVVNNAVNIIKKLSLKTPPINTEYLPKIDNVALLNDMESIKILDFETVIGNTAKIFSDENEKYRFLYLPKSLTNNLVKIMVENRMKYNFDIILKSPINIQLNDHNLNNLWKLRNKIYTLNPINLVAVCYNPYSPKGYQFNDSIFKKKLEDKIGIKIYNVKKGAING